MQRNRTTAPRGAFTVIELMIVISIIALLAAMALSALAGATEQARAQRTRAIINKIDQLIMEKWDSYRTRAIPYTRGTTPRASATNRLNALRELQRLELPQNASDIWDNPAYLSGGASAIPAVNRSYRRRCLAKASWNGAYDEAECLYLIISGIRDGEKNAIDFFSPAEIGDLDADGQPEILDGWGNPINFLRWPSGYTADHPTAPALTHQVQNGSIAPDPFDPLKVDPMNSGADQTTHTFALTPLIWSVGPDGENGIEIPDASFTGYSQTTRVPNDPYDPLTSGPRFGTIGTAGDATDNITNHDPGEQ